MINRITVGGVRQVLLEVRGWFSRTKLRTLGLTSPFSGDDFAVSSVSGLISSLCRGAVATSAGETFTSAWSWRQRLFGVLEAMR